MNNNIIFFNFRYFFMKFTNNNFEDLTKKDWYSSKNKVSNLIAEFKLYIYVAKIDSDNF